MLEEALQNSLLYWYVPYIFGIIYLGCIYTGTRAMRSRAPYDLKRWLAAWNTSLALFSVCGFLGTFPVVVKAALAGSRADPLSFCTMIKLLEDDNGSYPALWFIVFVLSKPLE